MSIFGRSAASNGCQQRRAAPLLRTVPDNAYALTLASLMLTSGVLADRYGRRLLFAGGLGIFTAGSALCGLAQSPTMLIAARSGQGVGGAMMFATSLALLAQTFHGRDRATAFAAWGAISGAAVALGPVLGGLITSGISWRGIFLVNVPIGLGALAVRLQVALLRSSSTSARAASVRPSLRRLRPSARFSLPPSGRASPAP